MGSRWQTPSVQQVDQLNHQVWWDEAVAAAAEDCISADYNSFGAGEGKMTIWQGVTEQAGMLASIARNKPPIQKTKSCSYTFVCSYYVLS